MSVISGLQSTAAAGRPDSLALASFHATTSPAATQLACELADSPFGSLNRGLLKFNCGDDRAIPIAQFAARMPFDLGGPMKGINQKAKILPISFFKT